MTLDFSSASLFITRPRGFVNGTKAPCQPRWLNAPHDEPRFALRHAACGSSANAEKSFARARDRAMDVTQCCSRGLLSAKGATSYQPRATPEGCRQIHYPALKARLSDSCGKLAVALNLDQYPPQLREEHLNRAFSAHRDICYLVPWGACPRLKMNGTVGANATEPIAPLDATHNRS